MISLLKLWPNLVHSSKLLMLLASSFVLGFEPHRDPWSNLCSFQDHSNVLEWGILFDERKGLSFWLSTTHEYSLIRSASTKGHLYTYFRDNTRQLATWTVRALTTTKFKIRWGITKEIGSEGMGWFQMAQHMMKYLSVMGTVLNLPLHEGVEFLHLLDNSQLLRNTLLAWSYVWS
jgi:hypothetical protein